MRSLAALIEGFASIDQRLTMAGQALAGDTDSWREKVSAEMEDEARAEPELSNQ